MNVPLWVWAITIVVILGLLAFDFFFHVRKAHTPTLREAAMWSAIYVGLAILFGVLVWMFGGATMGAEYFGGYITEKALSVDNLFVFLIIMSSFAVPREDQQKVLLFGIVPGMLILATQIVWIPFWAAGVINGIGHFWGYRSFDIADASKNIVPWGILVGGEELHNNHHAYATSAKLSAKWYEFDIGWMYIRILEALGLAKVAL